MMMVMMFMKIFQMIFESEEAAVSHTSLFPPILYPVFPTLPESFPEISSGSKRSSLISSFLFSDFFFGLSDFYCSSSLNALPKTWAIKVFFFIYFCPWLSLPRPCEHPNSEVTWLSYFSFFFSSWIYTIFSLPFDKILPFKEIKEIITRYETSKIWGWRSIIYPLSLSHSFSLSLSSGRKRLLMFRIEDWIESSFKRLNEIRTFLFSLFSLISKGKRRWHHVICVKIVIFSLPTLSFRNKRGREREIILNKSGKNQ